MSIFSLCYFIFITLGLLAYYLVPNKIKPIILLIMSVIFVFSNSIFGFLVVVLTSFLAYVTAKQISTKINKKKYLILSLVCEILILFFLKYLFDLPAFTRAINIYSKTFIINTFVKKYIYPIGMSYFVLQIISYIFDVYWERIEYEKSYWKLLLYTCYFPQLIQGPISKYSELHNQLFKEHCLCMKNLKYGVQLVLYGTIKKMIIADRAGVIVNEIFYNDTLPKGWVIFFGLLIYGVQLYCDFSGGIDIIRGISQCFDIDLKENFRQPFFSLSLGDFWRRWHMSLGEWMKDYVFYPLSISKTFGKIKSKIKNKTNRKFANRVIMSASNIIVFSLVGIWHGLGTNFFAWGLYNGIILAISVILADKYVQWKKTFKIDSKSIGWKAFSLLRTFAIVTIGWVFDCATTAKGSVQLFVNSFKFCSSNMSQYSISKTELSIVLLFFAIVMVIDVLHEKNYSIRDYLNKKPVIIQFALWIIIIQIIAVFSKTNTYGGFMYANF